jgi:hypothetical protein
LAEDVAFIEAGSAVVTLLRMWCVCYKNANYRKRGVIKAGAMDLHNATVKRHLAKLIDLGLIAPVVDKRGKVAEFELCMWMY